MSAPNDDTILPPPRKPSQSNGLDGETVLPSNNTTGIHNPGDVIDNRYKVIREIGRGGMGVVYEVEDDLADIRVAVKRLLPELANRSDLLEVFKREGKNAMRFTAESPRFVTMRHLGNDAHGLYLVMDFVEDVTLRTYVQAQPDHRLSVSSATAIMYELATALSDLHRLGFVHRDLKPENIFVRVDADGVRIRLVDFGLTKDDVEGTRTSMRGAGTSGYSSPEQRKGLPTTAATDIYAFGVIAYEMLTGELPSIGDSVSDYVTDVSEDLITVIVQCQSTRPERRPTDGSSLITLFNADRPKPSQESELAVTTLLPSQKPDKPIVQSGTLKLVGVPAGAQIYLDGVEVHGTQHIREFIGSSQRIELLVKCQGYEDYGSNVLLIASEVTDESVQMKKTVVKVKHSVPKFPELMRYVEAMRHVPAGTFRMGRKCVFGDTKPIHTVTLSDFRMGATPVSVAVWREYCTDTGSDFINPPRWGWVDTHPVVGISWIDIMGVDGIGGFCRWASNVGGLQFALPTEAQFEFAARGDQLGQEFPWGSEYDDSMLWSSKVTNRSSTAPVVRQTNIHRNSYGLSDMSGNVWQWCYDSYAPYSVAEQSDPVGPLLGLNNPRCTRGGSWSSLNTDYFRCAYRNWCVPDYRVDNIGFRLVVKHI
jgi:formylglycine-generating enzyme required for sulfatase activity